MLEKVIGGGKGDSGRGSELKIRMFDNDISLTSSSKASVTNVNASRTTGLFKKQEHSQNPYLLEDCKFGKNRGPKRESAQSFVIQTK
mmetsp:Transcript_3880/g.2876  ORF Transcript_3880/g.2876 Transcript_3880/m.2876 type:complete len:87 (+) Transcript_3880:350-610(+)